MIISVSDREETIVGKGENAGYQHFSFPHNVFRRPISQGCENQGLFGKGLNVA